MLASGAANKGYGKDYVESPAQIAYNVVYMITQQYLSGRSKSKPTIIVIFDGYMRASIKKRGDYSNLYHSAQLQAQDILINIQEKNPGRLGFVIIRSAAEADFDVLKLEQDFAKVKPTTRDPTQVFAEPAPASAPIVTVEGEDKEPTEEEFMRKAREIDAAKDALDLVNIGAEDDLDTDEVIGQGREAHRKGQPQDGGEEVVLPEYINDHSDSPADQGAADFIRCRIVSNDGDLFMHSDATTLIAEGRQNAGNIFKVNTADFLAKLKDEIVKRKLDGKHASLIAFLTFAFLGDYRMIVYKGMGEIAFFNIIANALETAQEPHEGDNPEGFAGGIHARRFFASIARQFAEAQTTVELKSWSKAELASPSTDGLRKINEQVIRHVNDAIKGVAFACAPLGVCDNLLKCMPKNLRLYIKEKTGIDIPSTTSKPLAGIYLSTSGHIVLLRQLLLIRSGHSPLIDRQQISVPVAMSDWILELGVRGVQGYKTELKEHPFQPLQHSKVSQVDHDEFIHLIEGVKAIPQSLQAVDIPRRRADSEASLTEVYGSVIDDLPVGDLPSFRAPLDKTARSRLFVEPSEAGDSAYTTADHDLQDPITEAVSVIASNYRERRDRQATWVPVNAERRSEAATLFSRILKKRLFRDVELLGFDLADEWLRRLDRGITAQSLQALRDVTTLLENVHTSFDEPVIDLLGASEVLLMIIASHPADKSYRQILRHVFGLLYNAVPKHNKDERCRAAQHLAQRLWSSEAVRQYGLRSSNIVRILELADVLGLDGIYHEHITDPLTLLSKENSGVRMPWTYLERFCVHLGSTQTAFQTIDYTQAQKVMDKVFLDHGFSLDDILKPRGGSLQSHKKSILSAVLGQTQTAASLNDVSLRTSESKAARRTAGEAYLRTLQSQSNGQEGAGHITSPHDLIDAPVALFNTWHIVPSGPLAPTTLELLDRPLFRHNREARVFYGGTVLQQQNSERLVWLLQTGMRSVLVWTPWRALFTEIAATHEGAVVSWTEICDAADRSPLFQAPVESPSRGDLLYIKQRVRMAIIAASLNMLEKPADEADLEYCDYLHYGRDTALSDEIKRNWQRIPEQLPLTVRQQAEAVLQGTLGHKGETVFIRRSDVQRGGSP